MNPLEKIHVLDDIEKEIILCLQSAGQALQELSKEKSSQKNAETQTAQFLKSLQNVEMKLSEQINYLTQVSTGQPHEGSGYASAKVLQMAWHRISHVRSRVRELEETKAKYTHAARQQQQQRQQQHAAAAALQQQQQQQQMVQQQTLQQDPNIGGSNANPSGGLMSQDVNMNQGGGN
ncbi:mediator of RNA polymerase II transcription subunit 11 [Stomoxys calcitrans]|uniref:Mediator of RNA polymerase II transcription subunit 11 n=1 Tax=Stomoxys calcitrans TaxID=35570 RepID=A0A1I8PTE5_STOCA|nr:mediator of RNA polymerase II transcription subunit 11 [Stomoxys calcitrans]